MFDDDFENDLENPPPRRDENDDENMDDLFAGFSDDVLEDVDDPFASLDQVDEDDLFSRLETTEEEGLFEDEWREPAPEAGVPAAEESLPPLPDSAVPEWLNELGIERDEIVEERVVVVEEGDEAEPLAELSGTGPQGIAFGMTAQQRLILAIFLFLDVAVLGFLLLYVLGVIQF